jgi:hypothetical protein
MMLSLEYSKVPRDDEDENEESYILSEYEKRAKQQEFLEKLLLRYGIDLLLQYRAQTKVRYQSKKGYEVYGS